MTTTSTEKEQRSSTGSGERGVQKSSSSSVLSTPQGKTSIADSVVAKIAGMAAREVDGVYKMGGGAARAMGSLRERFPGSGPSVTSGVAVEVGETQAAIDLDVVVEYGVSIGDLSQGIRRNVISSVERMTGLQVTEVNIAVGDVHLPDEQDDTPAEEPQQPRVR